MSSNHCSAHDRIVAVTAVEHDAILEVLIAWPTPEKLRETGRARINAKLKKHKARRHTAWTEDILTALEKQTVIVTGTDAAGIVIPHLARQLIHLHTHRADVAREVEEIVVDHPLYPVLTSMPGIRFRTAAVLIAELSEKTFTSAAALASYAGVDKRIFAGENHN
jgi:transposase